MRGYLRESRREEFSPQMNSQQQDPLQLDSPNQRSWGDRDWEVTDWSMVMSCSPTYALYIPSIGSDPVDDAVLVKV